jgi:hypothetical protein
MEKKWKQFERLVAAVHEALAGADAKIQWDDEIAGRQFDLSIRFSRLAYDYLTVVEVKDYLTPVKEVEAFVTKARRAGANKIVMVSSQGFQSGAIEVARDERIDLFVLAVSEQWPASVKVVQQKPVLGIDDLELLGTDQHVVYRFPTLANALRYYAEHTLFLSREGQQTLHEVIMSTRTTWEPQISGKSQSITVPLVIGTQVQVPFLDPITATALRFSAASQAASN